MRNYCKNEVYSHRHKQPQLCLTIFHDILFFSLSNCLGARATMKKLDKKMIICCSKLLYMSVFVFYCCYFCIPLFFMVYLRIKFLVFDNYSLKILSMRTQIWSIYVYNIIQFKMYYTSTNVSFYFSVEICKVCAVNGFKYKIKQF